MPDLNTLQQELNSAEQGMRLYESPELPQEVNKAVMNEWTPLLTRSTGETGRMMKEFLPRFNNIPYEGLAAGTSAADLTPQQKMQVMGQELGIMGGELTASSQLSEYLGGKAAEMQRRALEAMQFGNKTAAEKYQRSWERYQLAWQAAEAEKARKAQLAAARLAATGGGGNQYDDVEVEIDPTEIKRQYVLNTQKSPNLTTYKGPTPSKNSVAGKIALTALSPIGGFAGQIGSAKQAYDALMKTKDPWGALKAGAQNILSGNSGIKWI